CVRLRVMALLSPALTPAQQAVNDALRSGERPTFDSRLGDDLRAEIERGLEPVTGPIDALAIAPVFISKHKLNQVHGCEVRYLAERENGFAGWTVPMARGTVAHRAIELSMHARGTPSPSELVDHSLARLGEDSGGLAEFLQSLPELDRADLRG